MNPQRQPHPIDVGNPAWPHVLRVLLTDRKALPVKAIASRAGRSPAATWRTLRLLQSQNLVDCAPIPGGRGFEWWLRL